jgi:hypothetical protein
MTMMVIFTAQILWVWHTASDFTREGARYAATRCWQPGASNVLGYMRQNVPPTIDQSQFRDGVAEIEVAYFSRNADSGEWEEFTCDGAECSRDCVPELVRVRIANYQFAHFMNFLGLPPVRIPDFQTQMPMESAGCSADDTACTP